METKADVILDAFLIFRKLFYRSISISRGADFGDKVNFDKFQNLTPRKILKVGLILSLPNSVIYLGIFKKQNVYIVRLLIRSLITRN